MEEEREKERGFGETEAWRKRERQKERGFCFVLNELGYLCGY